MDDKTKEPTCKKLNYCLNLYLQGLSADYFANSLDIDQAQRSGSKLSATLMVHPNGFFENINFEKS